MITVEPVIETSAAEGFTAWPVSTHLGSQFLVLSGELTSADVGTVMAVIAVYNRIASSGRDDGVPSPAGLIQRIIRAGSLIAPGWPASPRHRRGPDREPELLLRPRGLAGVEPDCPIAVAPARPHPDSWVEHLGDRIRVWPDGGDEAVPPAGTSPIEIPASDPPSLIAGAHKQLQEFLGLLEPWAFPLAGAAAGRLCSALAAHFHVSWSAPAQQSAP